VTVQNPTSPSAVGTMLGNRDALADLCSLDRRPLAGRAGAQNEEVVVVRCHGSIPRP